MADITVPVYQYTPLKHPESIRILNLHPAEDRNAPIVCSFLDENPIVPKIEEWECRAVDPRGCTGDCFYGPIDGEFPSGSDGESSSAEAPKNRLADELQELAIESTEQAYGRHNDDAISINDTKSTIKKPARKWHERVFRPPGFPKYEALSYTWGAASDSLPITLGSDGAQIKVTRNCHGALRNLRSQTSFRLLWIDAICMNQQDNMEKTHQVRMMGQVYAASYRVDIYLGEETPSSRILFEELALAEQTPKVRKPRGWDLDRPIPSTEVAEAMDTLFERPWFNRVWVLQEANNSKLATFPDAAILCGPSSSRSSLLSECVFGYNSNRVTQKPPPFSLKSCTWEVKAQGLKDAIAKTLGCAATDARDKIFALKGLTQASGAAFDNLISYTDGFEITFFKVAQYLLESESDLSVLSFSRHLHQMAMPSWIPSWTNQCVNIHIEGVPRIGGPDDLDDDLFPAGRKTFAVRSRMCSCGRCTGNHAIMHVEGYKVSAVEHIGTPFMATEILLLEGQVRSMLSSIDNSNPWDHEAAHESPDEIILQKFRNQKYEPYDILVLLLRGYSSSAIEHWLSNEPNTEVSDYIHSSLYGYSLCLDSEGEIGLVPKEARLGDAICYVKQAYFPILLRPRDAGGWELISGFCSHGIGRFYNAAVGDLISAGYKEAEFEIW